MLLRAIAFLVLVSTAAAQKKSPMVDPDVFRGQPNMFAATMGLRACALAHATALLDQGKAVEAEAKLELCKKHAMWGDERLRNLLRYRIAEALQRRGAIEAGISSSDEKGLS